MKALAKRRRLLFNPFLLISLKESQYSPVSEPLSINVNDLLAVSLRLKLEANSPEFTSYVAVEYLSSPIYSTKRLIILSFIVFPSMRSKVFCISDRASGDNISALKSTSLKVSTPTPDLKDRVLKVL